MGLEPYVKQKRRTKGIELTSFSISLPTQLVDELDRHGISSQRGAGNLSVFLETAAYIALGLFASPKMAFDNVVRLIRNDDHAPRKKSTLGENLEEVAKLLVD